ncbi:MAG: histidine kinase dimerization/phospho-acceptor domain-containing protein [Chitinophagaceae bacterium]
MTTGLNISIKRRIYLSFLFLVCLFALGGIITNITLQNNKRQSERLTTVVDPSLHILDDFKKMMFESKMYTTNWVFLRYNNEDKDHLKKLHDADYAALKVKLNLYSADWINKGEVDSLHKICSGFEALLVVEKNIMSSLQAFSDYDDPVLKLEAERQVEDEVIPRTAALITSLNGIYNYGVDLKTIQNQKLENSSSRLGSFIIGLAIAVICISFLLSIYLTRVIIAPVKKINAIVNDLGKGILRGVDRMPGKDEIGSMIQSINNLSGKLQLTANFAHEIGLRNFDVPFKPLSDEDTLGKALITMRENLKSGETNLEIKNRELERKNKELEQFAYVASHDLQEPLRTTVSFVKLLQQHYKGKLDAKGEKHLAYIAQASTRMQVLITDLLEYSRIGSKKELMEVDCNIVMKEVLADLGLAIKETGAEINAEPLPVIQGYGTEIKQLFQNLAFNAIKFRKKDTSPKSLLKIQETAGNLHLPIMVLA